MEPITSRVIVFEENQTRAELYALWLEQYDVSIALTKQQTIDEIDQAIAVAILDQDFADGNASTLLEILRSRSPACRVIATRDRSSPFPSLGVDHKLMKPVFKDDLLEMVQNLLRRANYHLALVLYFRTTARLSSIELDPDESGTEDEQYKRLKQRAAKLRALLLKLGRQMSEDDISAVKQSISVDTDIQETGGEEKVDSKYRPSKCTNCRQEWSRAEDDGAASFTRLGAYVWRCGACGHVQMHADPSHQDIGSYRR